MTKSIKIKKMTFQLCSASCHHSMLLYVCSVRDHWRHQNLVRTKKKEAHTCKGLPSVSLMFSDRPTATWNLFFFFGEEAKIVYAWWCHSYICPPIDHIKLKTNKFVWRSADYVINISHNSILCYQSKSLSEVITGIKLTVSLIGH